MKHLFAALTLVTVGFSQAQARSMQAYQDIKLFGVTSDEKLTGEVVVGQINYLNNTIKFELFEDRCNSLIPTDSLYNCRAMPTLIMSFEAPYKSQNPGICGAFRYSSFMESLNVNNYSAQVEISAQGTQCGFNPRNQSMIIRLINSRGLNRTIHLLSRPKALVKFLAK